MELLHGRELCLGEVVRKKTANQMSFTSVLLLRGLMCTQKNHAGKFLLFSTQKALTDIRALLTTQGP
jgi:hypothetical protein